jgi:hypothetical protein
MEQWCSAFISIRIRRAPNSKRLSYESQVFRSIWWQQDLQSPPSAIFSGTQTCNDAPGLDRFADLHCNDAAIGRRQTQSGARAQFLPDPCGCKPHHGLYLYVCCFAESEFNYQLTGIGIIDPIGADY